MQINQSIAFWERCTRTQRNSTWNAPGGHPRLQCGHDSADAQCALHERTQTAYSHAWPFLLEKMPFFVTLFPFPAHHDSMIDGTLFFPWTSNYSWFGIKYQDILQTKIVNSPGDSRKWNWAHHDSRAHAAIVRSARQRYWTVPVWSWFLK